MARYETQFGVVSFITMIELHPYEEIFEGNFLYIQAGQGSRSFLAEFADRNV